MALADKLNARWSRRAIGAARMSASWTRSASTLVSLYRVWNSGGIALMVSQGLCHTGTIPWGAGPPVTVSAGVWLPP